MSQSAEHLTQLLHRALAAKTGDTPFDRLCRASLHTAAHDFGIPLPPDPPEPPA